MLEQNYLRMDILPLALKHLSHCLETEPLFQTLSPVGIATVLPLSVRGREEVQKEFVITLPIFYPVKYGLSKPCGNLKSKTPLLIYTYIYFFHVAKAHCYG